jgi:hypothetical protein
LSCPRIVLISLPLDTCPPTGGSSAGNGES